jgi:hypothetical protein
MKSRALWPSPSSPHGSQEKSKTTAVHEPAADRRVSNQPIVCANPDAVGDQGGVQKGPFCFGKRGMGSASKTRRWLQFGQGQTANHLHCVSPAGATGVENATDIRILSALEEPK